jgi:hypothetical protein
MDVERYLASIDWVGAVLVGIGLVIVGLVLLRFLVATTSELGGALPRATDAAGRRILDARTSMPAGSWLCTTCRSVNVPVATHCYRGCGLRDDVGRTLESDPLQPPGQDEIAHV